MPDHLTDAERAQIDAAVDGGAITRCPPGAAMGLTRAEQDAGVLAFTWVPFRQVVTNMINGAKRQKRRKGKNHAQR